MRTCIYARKSTLKLGQKESIENQIKICRTKAKELGLDIVDIRQDTGTGTDDLNRPEVKKLIDDAVNGEYSCVIMKGISRLYRDTEKGLGLIKLLDRHDIRVITVEEMFDSGNTENRTGTGKLDLSRITMYLMFSEMESKKFADRVKYTQLEKARSGEWNQPNNIPFGYNYNPQTKKLEINPIEAHIVRSIFHLYLEGYSWRDVAAQISNDKEHNTKKWDYTSIGFILKNQAYVGDLIYNKRSKKHGTYKNPELYGKTREDIRVGNEFNDREKWIITENAHEPIIKREVFYKAQEMILEKATRKGVKNNTSLLAGIAKCGLCGASMTFRRGRTDKTGKVVTRNNYYCRNYIKNGNKFCISHHHHAENFEQFVMETLIYYRSNPKLIDEIIAENRNRDKTDESSLIKEKARIETEIKNISNKSEKLLEKNLNGDITDQQFKIMNSKFSNELNSLSDILAEINIQLSQTNELENKEDKFKEKMNEVVMMKEYTKEKQRYVLLGLINKVFIYPDGTCNFDFNF